MADAVSKVEDFVEGLSKEEIDKINSDPLLSKLYKSMISGMNKKFQLSAQEKQELSTKLETLQSQLSEKDGLVGQWNQWFAQVFPEGLPADVNLQEAIQMFRESQGGSQTGKHSNRQGKRQSSQGEGELTLQDLANALRQFQQAVVQERKNLLGEIEDRLDLASQLIVLSRKHGKDDDFDEMKVLDFALKNNLKNLEQAYSGAYQDKLIKAQVDSQVKTQLESEKSKQGAKTTTGDSSSHSTVFKSPSKEPARSWDEVKGRVSEKLFGGEGGGGEQNPGKSTVQ